MKTGCLIKGLIASTVFFAVIFYVATNKMDDYIVNPIKKFSVNYMTKDLKDELRFVKATPEKDSLFVHLNSFTKDITKMKTVNLNTVNDLVDSIKQYLDDSLVTQKDLENIKVIIEAELKNERSKKN